MIAQYPLLHLLHLASPALPIGGFHFSQGLEYAVEAGWVRSEADAQEWIIGVAEDSLGTLDLPVLARLHGAWMRFDEQAIGEWNAWLLACRETQELRAEDRHLGSALGKILAKIDVTETATPTQPCYATMFALACVRWQIAPIDALQAYAWTWLENQVLAAIKLVPLGQSAGQRVLHQAIPRLVNLATRALTLQDHEIGLSAIMQGVASARHEQQYTRLFRS